MRLLNKSSVPKYSQLARTSIGPGRFSRELDFFEKSVESIFNASRGFDIVLSDRDIGILVGLCRRFLEPRADEEIAKEAALEPLMKSLKDPDGLKNMEEWARGRRLAVQQARARIMKEAREKEERIRAESNMIGPDGNPIPKAEVAAMNEGKMKDVKPELHPEMSTDLKSIIENNLAVMTTASGNPIRSPHDVVAPPGGTPVSHNPKDYQKPRTVPAGQPEYFK